MKSHQKGESSHGGEDIQSGFRSNSSFFAHIPNSHRGIFDKGNVVLFIIVAAGCLLVKDFSACNILIVGGLATVALLLIKK